MEVGGDSLSFLHHWAMNDLRQVHERHSHSQGLHLVLGWVAGWAVA